jgi:flavin-binding protein dodecin
MSVVKIVELIGESNNSWEEAADNLLAEAKRTLRGITRVGIKEFDIRVDEDGTETFRVRGELSFRVEHHD